LKLITEFWTWIPPLYGAGAYYFWEFFRVSTSWALIACQLLKRRLTSIVFVYFRFYVLSQLDTERDGDMWEEREGASRNSIAGHVWWPKCAANSTQLNSLPSCFLASTLTWSWISFMRLFVYVFNKIYYTHMTNRPPLSISLAHICLIEKLWPKHKHGNFFFFEGRRALIFIMHPSTSCVFGPIIIA